MDARLIYCLRRSITHPTLYTPRIHKRGRNKRTRNRRRKTAETSRARPAARLILEKFAVIDFYPGADARIRLTLYRTRKVLLEQITHVS